MDTVFIEGLCVHTVIGAYAWERTIRQQLIVDLRMFWDTRAAASQDLLEDALDYAQICQRIEAFAETAQYLLVETFAEQLANVLQEEFKISSLVLKVSKPDAVAAARVVGVEISRTFPTL